MIFLMPLAVVFGALPALLQGAELQRADIGEAWVRHTIDASSRGADGVRLADVNGDGHPDIATPWEEGGVVRAYLNPGPEHVAGPWLAVTVGTVSDAEDAVFVDVDADGAIDVVSCCEGATKRMWVHWAPKDAAEYLNADAWETAVLPASQGAAKWMFCLPISADAKNGVDLVAGAKGEGAQVGWFEAPEHPRDLADWTWHPICPVGWVMSLVARDMDGNGRIDVVVSDRKGPGRGCFWLECPGPARASSPWIRRRIGAADKEVMFLALADLDRDRVIDVLVATCGPELVYLPGGNGPGRAIALPKVAGTGKSVAVGDVDLDGQLDVVFSCEHAEGRSGVMWLSRTTVNGDVPWRAHDVSGPEGAKFDLVQLHDLDTDGDPDVITCEEREGLGIVWYENPTRQPGP